MALMGTARAAGDRMSVRWEKYPDPRTLANWDVLVQRASGTDVTQLSVWSAIRARAGFSPLYLFAYRSDTLVGGCLVLRRRLFGVLPVCYLPYGPLVEGCEAEARRISRALVFALTRLARRSAMTFVQPPEGAHEVSRLLLDSGFRLSDAGIAPSGSYRLDLTAPLSEIRGGFSKRLKSWTNRWAAHGVVIRRGDDRDVKILADLLTSTAARQGFDPPDAEELSAGYRLLSETGHAAIFIGEVDGQPVAADLVTMRGDTVRGRRCGFDPTGVGGRLSVPAAVRWEIIKWAKEEGYRWLDFGGLPERMLDDMLNRGIRNRDDWPSAHRAKLSFNGTPFRYPPAVELLRPSPVRWAYDFARHNHHGRRIIDRVKASLRLSR